MSQRGVIPLHTFDDLGGVHGDNLNCADDIILLDSQHYIHITVTTHLPKYRVNPVKVGGGDMRDEEL